MSAKRVLLGEPDAIINVDWLVSRIEGFQVFVLDGHSRTLGASPRSQYSFGRGPRLNHAQIIKFVVCEGGATDDLRGGFDSLRVVEGGQFDVVNSVMVEAELLHEAFRDGGPLTCQVEQGLHPSWSLLVFTNSIKFVCADPSGDRTDPTVFVPWVNSYVFPKNLAGLNVVDAANPVDADLGGVRFGLPESQSFLKFEGTEVEVERHLRVLDEIHLLRGRSPNLLR